MARNDGERNRNRDSGGELGSGSEQARGVVHGGVLFLHWLCSFASRVMKQTGRKGRERETLRGFVHCPNYNDDSETFQKLQFDLFEHVL
ncbi:hypothetical protein NL676_030905 [Syzygium grande]|nr:hypothetical protein NL676_030905 [Syzygium grande]